MAIKLRLRRLNYILKFELELTTKNTALMSPLLIEQTKEKCGK